MLTLTIVCTPSCFLPVSSCFRPNLDGRISWRSRFYSHEYSLSRNSNSNIFSFTMSCLLALLLESCLELVWCSQSQLSVLIAPWPPCLNLQGLYWIVPVPPARGSAYDLLGLLCRCGQSPCDELLEEEAVHLICFVPPRCIPLFLQLLPLSFAHGGLSQRRYWFFPCLLVDGFMLPLPVVFVDCCLLLQQGDPFWHHHGVSNHLLPWLCKLSPVLQLFNKSGQGFYKVVGPYHIFRTFF